VSREICWITWENHRRSIELARELGANYYFVSSNETFIIRHFLKMLKTIAIIYKSRNALIIVQNPSRILAALAALMKLIFKFPLVVDRHTNFRLGKGISKNPAIWFVILCSEFSLKIADLTIVTNEYLKKLVERKGGRALVLHDKIPKIDPTDKRLDLPNGTNVLFVCTYAPDEPYLEVIAAAKLLSNDCHIHLTGNYHKVGLTPESPEIPNNIHLLGFVSNEEYEAYMLTCDVIMVLTDSEWVIVCGGYEAAGAQKPLITSNTITLKEFYKGYAYHTASTPESIAQAISEVSSNIKIYSHKMRIFSELEGEVWKHQWFRFLDRALVL